MSQTPPETEQNSFKRLYKMSTTAGVGTQEYVAVNTPAVVTVLAGLASIAVLVSLVMAVIPIFAIITGLIALNQIRRSGGTQTGRGLAIGGMLIAVLVLGKVGVDTISEARQFNESKSKISSIFDTFAAATASGDYATAYGLFTPGFQQVVSLERFQGEFKQLAATPGLGGIAGVDWNKRLESVVDPAAGGKDIARAVVYLKFKEAQANHVEATPVLSRGKGQDWLLESFAPMFQTAPPSQGGGRPTGAAGGAGGAGQQPPPG